jgi:D-proline reductase (dithiol) PrdB
MVFCFSTMGFSDDFILKSVQAVRYSARMDFETPILEDAAAWQAQFSAGWLKHHQSTGDFDWAQYRKPTNTQAVSGGAVKLSRSRVLLISSAGTYLRETQPPFDAAHPYGDYSIRVFPSSTPLDQIGIAHDHYDNQFVNADRQVLLPLRHFEDLAASGEIGSVAPNVISFMGYQPDVGRVVNELVPQIIEAVYAEKADAALLVPS